MNAPACSVVVPNRDGARFLHRCLPALRDQSLADFELVLVDNGSGDDSVALTRAAFPDARILELGHNAGFARAMNAGIRVARGRYVAFLNNDTEPRPGWLAELVACLERHPRAAVAASKTLLGRDPSLIDGAGDVLGWKFLPGPRGHGLPDGPAFADEIEVLSASGAACLWRADVLRELGAFDERFFAYYEDVDLVLRARLLGYECWFAPRSVALHERGATAGGDPEFAFFHPVKNRWFLLVKLVPARLLVRHGAELAYGDLVWWTRAARGGGVRAVARAYAEALRNMRPVLHQRRALAARRRISVQALDELLRDPPGYVRAARAWSRRRARSDGEPAASAAQSARVPADPKTR